MNKLSFIPVNEPLLDGNEKRYLAECIDSGWISSEGPFVARFEKELSSRVGRSYGVAVTNGTAALDLAITALGVGPGDEVILPSFTIISCIHQIVRTGALPVLVDCDPCTFNMNVHLVEEKITSKTKAIMVVHIYGLPVDMDPIIALAQKYNLKIIEDTAEAIGLKYKNIECGAFGDISTFSFYSNKHITTGEGGMLLTNDLELASICREYRNLCFQVDKRFIHEHIGWNLRMTSLQAAVGVAQLERLDEFLKLKQSLGSSYNKNLGGISALQLPLEKTEYANNGYWVYPIVLKDCIPFGAKEAIKMMKERGVECRPFFYPLHRQPVLKKMGLLFEGDYPISDNAYERGFYIPSGLATTKVQVDKVSEILCDLFGGY